MLFPLVLSKIKHSCSVAQPVPLFATPWTAACQASLSFTIFVSLFKLMPIESVMPSNHLILCCPLLLLSSIFSGISDFSSELASGGQSTGAWASASASVLPTNIQGWFPLGLTGLISLLSRGLSRVFSNTTVQKHQFLGAQPSWALRAFSARTSIHDYWKKHGFDYMESESEVTQSCPTLRSHGL